MSAHPYVILTTYSGMPGKVHVVNTGDKHVAASEENLPVLQDLAQRLLNEGVFTTAQIYREVGPVLLPRPVVVQ